jgi:hypothetical protein
MRVYPGEQVDSDYFVKQHLVAQRCPSHGNARCAVVLVRGGEPTVVSQFAGTESAVVNRPVRFIGMDLTGCYFMRAGVAVRFCDRIPR